MSMFPEIPDWAVPGPAPTAAVKTADLRRQVDRLDVAQNQIPPGTIDITQINSTTIATISGWAPMYERIAFVGSAATAATYIIGIESNVAATAVGGANTGLAVLYIDPTMYRSGAQIRVQSRLITNSTAPGTTSFNFALFPVATTGGVAAIPTVATLGTTVAGTTAGIASPGASATFTNTSTTVAIPAAGFYVLGFVLTAATAVNSFEVVQATLWAG